MSILRIRRVLTDLAPEVMRALWERVAGRRRRYPGVPPSGVALPEAPGSPWMTVSMLAPVAQMEALLVFFCMRWCIGEMSSTMANGQGSPVSGLLCLPENSSWEISVDFWSAALFGSVSALLRKRVWPSLGVSTFVH